MFATNMAFKHPVSPLGNTMADALSAFVPSIVLSPPPEVTENDKETVQDVPVTASAETNNTSVVTASVTVTPVSSIGVVAKSAKTHTVRAPKHAQPVASAAVQHQQVVHGTKPKAEEKPVPKVTPVVDMNPHLGIEELLGLSGEALVRETRRLIAAGQTPVFSFELKARRTALSMSVSPVGSDVIRLTVEGGYGELLQGFPKGTSLSLEEIRGPVYESDVTRLNILANFRGAMMDLLLQAKA